LHKNLHLQINVLLSAGVPTVSNVTQSLAWHYPQVATVAADFRICKAPPAPTRPSAASLASPIAATIGVFFPTSRVMLFQNFSLAVTVLYNSGTQWRPKKK